MALTATFYTLNKRFNSTKRPTGGTSFDIILKSATDFLHPMLEIQTSEDMSAYNYFLFKGKYFRIDSCTAFPNFVYAISGKIDALATYRNEIIGTRAYITYDSSETTPYVADSRIAVKKLPLIDSESVSSDVFVSGGNLVSMTLVGEGGTGVWLFSKTMTNILVNGLSGTIWEDFSSSSDIQDWIKNFCAKNTAYGNISTCIRSAVSLPLDSTIANYLDSHLGSPKLGTYTLDNVTGYNCKSYVASKTVTVNIPWQSNGWLRCNPFTQIQLYLPYSGVVVVPNDQVIDSSSLTIKIAVDITNGSVTYDVRASNGYIVGIFNGDCGAPFAIGASNINTGGAISSAVSGIANGVLTGLGAFATGGASLVIGASSASGAVGGLGASLSQAFTPNTQCIGTAGGNTGGVLDNNIVCKTVYYEPTEDINTWISLYGTPTFKTKAIPSSGYVECARAHVPISGSLEESVMVDSYINSGVYIE